MDAGADVLRMLPFLFAAYLMIEALEHYSTGFTEKLLKRWEVPGLLQERRRDVCPSADFQLWLQIYTQEE